MRSVFIGDIHGCLRELLELTAKLDLKAEDRVYCLGDFMDKGPDPVGCLRLAQSKGWESVLGNHDEKHNRWRRHERHRQADPSFTNPMKPLREDEVEANKSLSDQDLLWIQERPHTLHPFPNLIVVHGGLLPSLSLKDQTPDKILRLRWIKNGKPVGDLEPPPDSCHWTEIWDGEQSVVYGHEAHSLSTPKIDTRPNGVACFGIDTGCVYGGRLTAMISEGPVFDPQKVNFVQVQAAQVYRQPPLFIPA